MAVEWGDVGTDSLSGASAGTAILPGWGTAIGGVIGAGVGFLQSASDEKNKKSMAPLQDPQQVDMLNKYQQNLNELKQRRRALDTGMMYKPEQEEIKQQGQAAINAVSKVTGGNVGASVSAMNLVNRGTGRNLGKLFSNMSKESGDVTLEGLKVNEMMSGLIDTMASRRLDIQMYQSLTAQQKARQQNNDVMKQILGTLSSGKFQSFLIGLLNKNGGTGAGVGTGTFTGDSGDAGDMPEISDMAESIAG